MWDILGIQLSFYSSEYIENAKYVYFILEGIRFLKIYILLIVKIRRYTIKAVADNYNY